MRVLGWCVPTILFLVGVAMLLPAIYTAFWTDWLPKNELRPSEVERIAMACDYVELHLARTRRMPWPAEFQGWANSAPGELRLEGVGFTYLPVNETSYVFEWWGGNSYMRWRSGSSVEIGEISESDYFFFGNKLFDLIVFLGLATGAICAARVTMPTRRVRNGH